MIKVYTDDALEFVGTRKQVAEYIGISISTIYKMGLGYDLPLPHKAKCDYIIINDMQFRKKYTRKIDINKMPASFVEGYQLQVLDKIYTLTKVETFGKRCLYTWDNNIRVITLGKVKSYNALYQSLYRNINK